MNSTSLVIVLLVILLSLILLVLLILSNQKQIQSLMTDHRAQRANWEIQQERLMNRVMTKEWSSFLQVQGAMSSPSTSDGQPPVGMSDEEEMRRAGEAIAGQQMGEVFVEFDNDFGELGLDQA